MGINSKCPNVYLIDFGLSKYYLNKTTHQHIEYNDNKHFIGTIRYASLRTHAGIEQSRRDDLESLAYTLIYLSRAETCLPWQGIKCSTKKAKQEKIYEIKLHTHIEILCLNLPKEFQEFLIYTRQLAFAEEPNYFYLFSLIKQIYQTMNIKNDFIYDWIINNKQGKEFPIISSLV
jgi:casein kinase I family protein HRR25